MTKGFTRKAKKLGFTKLRFHDLRGTHETLLLDNGVQGACRGRAASGLCQAHPQGGYERSSSYRQPLKDNPALKQFGSNIGTRTRNVLVAPAAKYLI
jgi:hypothetical protein